MSFYEKMNPQCLHQAQKRIKVSGYNLNSLCLEGGMFHARVGRRLGTQQRRRRDVHGNLKTPH